MEGIGEIIMVVVVLALSILGSTKKKKKPQQSQAEPAQMEEKVTLEDIWRELTGGAPTENSKPVGAKLVLTEVSNGKEEYVFSGMADSKEIEYAQHRQTSKKVKKIQKPQQRKGSDNSLLADTDAGNINSGRNDLLDAFDIRKAVLYSEIMQPKFKQYK